MPRRLRDLLVGPAGGQELHHFPFAIGERLDHLDARARVQEHSLGELVIDDDIPSATARSAEWMRRRRRVRRRTPRAPAFIAAAASERSGIRTSSGSSTSEAR